MSGHMNNKVTLHWKGVVGGDRSSSKNYIVRRRIIRRRTRGKHRGI